MNLTHVAIKESVKCTWSFVAPSTAVKCVEEIEELSEICELLFPTFSDFVIPLEANFNLLLFPDGSDIPTSEESDPGEPTEHLEMSVSDDDGVDVNTLVEAFHSSDSSDSYVQRILIDRMKVRMLLESGDMFVDRHNGSRRYNVDTPLERPPAYDPLYVEIAHLPNVDFADLDSNFIFVIRVSTKSDIWFEDTEIGQVNCKRLAGLLGRIDEALNPEKMTRSTEWDTTDKLKEVY